jgi:hypothetical protein
MLSRGLTNIVARTGLRFLGRLAVVGRQLWLEVTGTLFLTLGVAALPSVLREWRGESLSRALIASAFAALMIYFGVTSFLRARKVGSR